MLALREAARVCAPGGFVLAAAISRLAPALDGIGNGWIVDEHKFETVLLQLAEGASGDREPGFPAISYFHHAEELAQEAREARLDVQASRGPPGSCPTSRRAGAIASCASASSGSHARSRPSRWAWR